MELSADSALLSALFTDARSQNGWTPEPVDPVQLVAAYDIARMGPTSLNCQPLRVVYLMSDEAKGRLLPAVWDVNREKVRTAPVVAIFAYDTRFHVELPRLFPHRPQVAQLFEASEAFAEETAFRNGTLQAAYLMLALRAVGLDIGPMSGFERAMVDAEFFAGSSLESNFICAVGHGDPAKLFGRLPRLTHDEVVTLL